MHTKRIFKGRKVAPPLPVLPPAGSDAGGQGSAISNQIADDPQQRQYRQQQFNTEYRDSAAGASTHSNRPRRSNRTYGTGFHELHDVSTQDVTVPPSGHRTSVSSDAEYPYDRSGSNPPRGNLSRVGDPPDDTENLTSHRPHTRNLTSSASSLRSPLSPRPEVQDWAGDRGHSSSRSLASGGNQRAAQQQNSADIRDVVRPPATPESLGARGLEDHGERGRPEGGWQNRDDGASAVGAGDDGVENTEAWRLGLQVGSPLDVKDTVDKWCEATVKRVDRERQQVFITYTYWSSKWDEWIPMNSPFLAPPATETYQEGGPLRVGHRIEAKDEMGKWLEADVLEVRADGTAFVHFRNFASKFDKWVSPTGGEVRQYGPYRLPPKGNRGVARKASLAPGQLHVRHIEQLSTRYEHYCRALGSKGLRVVPVEGDGNCLFRSVSHQIYGSDIHHRMVRARCMDYMESEAHFFEPYVEGDMAAFLRYLNEKRRNAVWGDDPEVQALCEIYDRPAEIWAYDQQLGAKTLRTFHEAAGGAGDELTPRRPPMRLSYYGGGHYDSLSSIQDGAGSGAGGARGGGAIAPSSSVGVAHCDTGFETVGTGADPPPEPGKLEDEALERSRRRAALAGDGRWEEAEMKQRREDETESERSVMDHALALSRNVFETQFNDLDSALVASVDDMEQSDLTSLAVASRDSELVGLQEEMLRTVQAQSEEEQLRHALEASCSTAAVAEAEADMVRQAIAESMGAMAGEVAVGDLGDSTARDAAPGHAKAGDGAMDEEEELTRVLALSGIEGGHWEASSAALHGFDPEDMEQDPELRQAIKASLAGQG